MNLIRFIQKKSSVFNVRTRPKSCIFRSFMMQLDKATCEYSKILRELNNHLRTAFSYYLGALAMFGHYEIGIEDHYDSIGCFCQRKLGKKFWKWIKLYQNNYATVLTLRVWCFPASTVYFLSSSMLQIKKCLVL